MKISWKILIEKILAVFAALILIIFSAVIMLAFNESARKPYTYGVTFRYVYARDLLGLDWKTVYNSVLTDLEVKELRLPVYWNQIEKQEEEYDFSDVDYQLALAEQHQARVILAIGRRVPGWPECHVPDWVKKYNDESKTEQALIRTMRVIVNRYKDNPAVLAWQVENEPFLTQFGECGDYPVQEQLDNEIAAVRQLDPNREIIVTDSGELSVWIHAAKRADVFGSTLYRKVYADNLEGYVSYHLPSIFFRAKKGFVHLLHPDIPIVNIELQGEPWTHRAVAETPFEEQFITFAPGDLTRNIEFAHQSGFSDVYVWGVEYWYWAAQHGHPEFLQEAKTIYQQ